MTASAFYDDIADLFHLVSADWEAGMRWQAEVLDRILGRALGPGPHRIVDVSCGIGTQALGLAARGHAVTGSDLSPRAIERARREAAARGLAIDLSVADMRSCDRHHRGPFDVVLSADNSVPHLLTDAEILAAFRAFHRLTRPGGVVLLTVRDYAQMDRSTPQLHPFGLRTDATGRWAVFQIWDLDGDGYDLAMYFVREGDAERPPEVRVARSRYYAVTADRLLALLGEAGFVDAERIDGEYYQPVLLAHRPGE